MTIEAVELERLRGKLKVWCVARSYYLSALDEQWPNKKRLREVEAMYAKTEEALLHEGYVLLGLIDPAP
jgi:hypothetical protein